MTTVHISDKGQIVTRSLEAYCIVMLFVLETFGLGGFLTEGLMGRWLLSGGFVSGLMTLNRSFYLSQM